MRAASLLTVSAFLLLTAAVVHAAKWQWPPVPAAEAIKNADFGREPTVEEVESQITRFGVKNSGLGAFFFTRFPFLPSGVPWRAYIYVPGAGPSGTYQFGWAQALFSDALTRTGAVVGAQVMYIFFQDGKMTWWQTNRSENCFQPADAAISAIGPCAELGAALPRPPGNPPAPWTRAPEAFTRRRATTNWRR